MSAAEGYKQELAMTLKFFQTTISVFDEADSGYTPEPELYTVAAHVAHAAPASHPAGQARALLQLQRQPPACGRASR